MSQFTGRGKAQLLPVPTEEVLRDLCDLRSSTDRMAIAVRETRELMAEVRGLLVDIRTAVTDGTAAVRESQGTMRAAADTTLDAARLLERVAVMLGDRIAGARS